MVVGVFIGFVLVIVIVGVTARRGKVCFGAAERKKESDALMKIKAIEEQSAAL